MNRILLLLAGGAIALPAAASGQRDCASHEPSLPYAGVAFTRIPSSRFSGSEAEVRYTEQQLLAGFYRARTASVCVEFGLDYQYTRYEFRDLASRNRDLHRLAVPVHWRYERNGMRFRGVVAPGISTSSNVTDDLFNRATSDDLQIKGRFEARAKTGDHDLFGGVAYDHAFGKPKLYPVAGAEFQALGGLFIRLAYPDPAARYELSEAQTITARLFPAGSVWHVVTDDFTDEFDYRVEALRAQFTWSLSLRARFRLDVSAGYEFDRRHVLTDDFGIRVRSRVDDDWLIGVSMRFGASPVLYTHGSHIGSL